MSRWSGALEHAFQVHLQNTGSRGSGVPLTEKLHGSNGLKPDASRTPAEASGVPGVPDWHSGTPGTPNGLVVMEAGVPEEQLSAQTLSARGTPGTPGTPDVEALPARDAARTGGRDVESILRRWAAGLDALRNTSEAPGFAPAAWRSLIEDGEVFLAGWGAEAARLGWTDFDLFGVHPVAPSARYDCMGLIPLIRGDEVVGMDEARATTRSRNGNLLTYLRRPMGSAVLLWQNPF